MRNVWATTDLKFAVEYPEGDEIDADAQVDAINDAIVTVVNNLFTIRPELGCFPGSATTEGWEETSDV